MKIRVLRPALEDLAQGRQFYERQSRSLGDAFFEHIFIEIDSLVHHAGIHSVHFGFHRLLAKRFPFAIYYRVIDHEAVVFRILDCRRNPDWIGEALKKGNLTSPTLHYERRRLRFLGKAVAPDLGVGRI